MYYVITDVGHVVLHYAQDAIRTPYDGEILLEFQGTLPATIKRLTTRVTKAPDGSPVIVEIPQVVAMPIDNLREAAFEMRDQLLRWTTEIELAGRAQPDDAVRKGHTFLYQAHRGAYLTLRDTMFTIDQRITFCEQMARGAENVTSPAEFFPKANNIPSPTGPIVWVNPATGIRLNLGHAVTFSDTAFNSLTPAETGALAEVNFAASDWVGEIPA